MQNLKSMSISKLKNYKATWVSFWQEKCGQSELPFLKSIPCHCWVGEAKGFDQEHKPITGRVLPRAGPGDASSQRRSGAPWTSRGHRLRRERASLLSCLLLHPMSRRVASLLPRYSYTRASPEPHVPLCRGIQRERPSPWLTLTRGELWISK